MRLYISLICLPCRSKLVEVNSVQPSIANFGRSLLGGYCSSYVPDFVLQGIGSDEKLRHCLVSDLSHAVQVIKLYLVNVFVAVGKVNVFKPTDLQEGETLTVTALFRCLHSQITIFFSRFSINVSEKHCYFPANLEHKNLNKPERPLASGRWISVLSRREIGVLQTLQPAES